MKTADRVKHVLSAALALSPEEKEYAVWSKNKKFLKSGLKRDYQNLMALSKKAKRTKDTNDLRLLIVQTQIILKKWESHKMYKTLGIKPQVVAIIRKAFSQMAAGRRVILEKSMPAEKIPRYVETVIGFGAGSLWDIRKLVNLNSRHMKSHMKTAEKEKHVLSAADDYAAWGKKKRGMLTDLKRDTRQLKRIAKNAERVKNTNALKPLMSQAQTVLKRWQNHTLYDPLGIKPQAIAALRDANTQMSAGRRVILEQSLPAEKIPRYVSNMIGFGADSLFKIQKAAMRHSFSG